LKAGQADRQPCFLATPRASINASRWRSESAHNGGLQQHGIPAEGAAVIASFGRAVREGYLDQLTDAVQQLAGRPPRSLREVVAAAL
jgi:hypothetical protein